MESKATKKTMLGDDELEQVSGGTVGVKGREPKVGDVASPVYNAELKEGPSDTSGTIRFLIFCYGMEILEILGDWYKVKVYSGDQITAFIHKSQVEMVSDFKNPGTEPSLPTVY